jgi:hypothetical protein
MLAFMTRDDVLRGGNEGGAYLESVGVTDLQKLTAEQWSTFLITVVNGANRAAGERIVGAWLAPFE